MAHSPCALGGDNLAYSIASESLALRKTKLEEEREAGDGSRRRESIWAVKGHSRMRLMQHTARHSLVDAVPHDVKGAEDA